MNLSVLERMARDGDMSSDVVRYLLDCRGECEWLDYKLRLSGLNFVNILSFNFGTVNC